MKVIVTGGAGFIGRWVVKNLLDDDHDVWVLDDLSNGRRKNLEEFKDNFHMKDFVVGDIVDNGVVSKLFENKFDKCIHAAAQINVQESLDNAKKAVEVNVVGTFNVLEEARKHDTEVILVSTCMVYDTADIKEPINEEHRLKAASPYAASKISSESLGESYYNGYGLPVTILRPFNTYGPCQKSNMEGGVVSIFIKRYLDGKTLEVFGDGSQTRDLLYVEDCADFIVNASFSKNAVGETINAGCGKDVTINELAMMICDDKNRIKHVPHHHPQAEIPKLVCDYSKAERLLNWKPETSLEEGIRKTQDWITNER